MYVCIIVPFSLVKTSVYKHFHLLTVHIPSHKYMTWKVYTGKFRIIECIE